MSKKKIFYMIFMTLILCIMTLGYAALQEKIDVEVEANIDSTYRVEITSVAEGTTVGDARSVQAPSYTNDSNNMTATFNVGLTNEKDYITYNITVTNYSTVDIKLNDIEITKTNNNMDVVKSGIKNGDIVLHGGNLTFTVKVKLNTVASSEQTGTITVSPKYTRLKGGVGEVTNEYKSYIVGDIVEFAGSNWYVIEDSGAAQDYVVLLKENKLTYNEVSSNPYTTLTGGMSFYVSETCHGSNYGYTTDDTSGCNGHNDYEGSNINSFLSGTYINTLESDNLKEVDGYKIRLLNRDDLILNLGYNNGLATCPTDSGNTVYSWLYGSTYYWTMIGGSSSRSVVAIKPDGCLSTGYNVRDGYFLRPVINLYKTAITSQ